MSTCPTIRSNRPKELAGEKSCGKGYLEVVPLGQLSFVSDRELVLEGWKAGWQNLPLAFRSQQAMTNQALVRSVRRTAA